MLLEKRVMGGKEYIYPTSIYNFKFNENIIGIKEEVFKLRLGIEMEARFSNQIEKINDKDSHYKLYRILDEFIDDKSDLDHYFIWDIYNYLFDTKKSIIRYRDHNVMIGGKIPPYYLDVQELMNQFIKYCNDDSKDWIEKAIVGHYFFEKVHPFDDGNGRIGRILFLNMINRKIGYYRGISPYLYNNLNQYYELLGKDSIDNIDEWNQFLLKGL